MEILRSKDFPMFTTHSLDPKESPLLVDLITQSDVVVADVDYTLVDFDQGHRAGIAALSSLFGEAFAKEADRLFQLKLEGQRRPANELWDKRDEFNLIIDATKTLQRSSSHKYGFKVFSRETDMILASQSCGFHLTKQDIEKGRDAYWQAVGQYAALYPDVEGFLHDTCQHGPLVLMSGSDAVMRVGKDCSLYYDPIFSAYYKKQRFTNLPFSYDRVVFGDPVDKPHKQFFAKVLRAVDQVAGFHPKETNILFVGDSLRNDLEVPYELGCKTLLIKRKAQCL